jgi:hypothetical protein
VASVWSALSEPRRRRLNQRNIAFMPLVPGQKLGCFERRHAKDRTDRGSGSHTEGRCDAAIRLAAGHYRLGRQWEW